MADTLPAPAPIPEMHAHNAAELDSLLNRGTGPFVVRGLVADWPMVTAAAGGADSARGYLQSRARPVPFTVSTGLERGDLRIFYDADMAVNFRTAREPLEEIFQRMEAAESDPQAPPIYLGSIEMAGHFDGLLAENPLDLSGRDCRAAIWIGTATRIAAHNDLPHNLACVAAGRRRFTLYPPDQFANLYPGPVDNTPAGRPVSMVDPDTPNLALHPRYRHARSQALTADLEPGDAIHIPSLWWHQVDALSPFNILVNYWWRDMPRWLGEPPDALLHAILAIRDLPEEDRAIWRQMFEHHVFSGGAEAAAHVPQAARSVLGPLTPESAARLRHYLLRQLSA